MKKIADSLLRAYKRHISPLMPSSCRFHPSCSEYARASVAKYGVFKGTLKAVYRIIRCNPFSSGGFDPA